MTNTLKTFWSFWTPDPDFARRRMGVERLLLERRRARIEHKQAMLRVRLAATVSAIEQLDQEMKP